MAVNRRDKIVFIFYLIFSFSIPLISSFIAFLAALALRGANISDLGVAMYANGDFARIVGSAVYFLFSFGLFFLIKLKIHQFRKAVFLPAFVVTVGWYFVFSPGLG